MPLLVINPKDNVGVALRKYAKGEIVQGIEVQEPIEFAFKMALREIAQGENIIKYGETIGRATQPIPKGNMVHVHNVESLRGRGDLRV